MRLKNSKNHHRPELYRVPSGVYGGLAVHVKVRPGTPQVALFTRRVRRELVSFQKSVPDIQRVMDFHTFVFKITTK
jgi:hypothetical protein